MREQAEAFLRMIQAERTWPLPSELTIHRDLQLWAAFRESDSEQLRKAHTPSWPAKNERGYVVDPLPEKISDAFANLIFGEDPEFKAANDQDQSILEEIIEENDLPSELRRAETIAASEGEVWWRLSLDPLVSTCPIIGWYSRMEVLPMFYGRRLVAVAFISRLDANAGTVSDVAPVQKEIGSSATAAPARAMSVELGELSQKAREEIVWRQLEVHTLGQVDNWLFKGKKTELGKRADLGLHKDTAELPETWPTSIKAVLAGRVVNKLGRNPKLGISDYAGVKDFFLALNESATIGTENARLTAKKRITVPMSMIGPDGKFDAGEDVIGIDPLDGEEGKTGEMIRTVEYSFDAEALIAYENALTDKVLTRTDVAPQLIGRDIGKAETGTALRTRMLNSVNAAQGKARSWDDQLPDILALAQQLDAEGPTDADGRSWADPTTPPSIKRSPALPEDPSDELDRHARAVTSEIESRETAIRALHPDWSDEQVDDELDAIRQDMQTARPGSLFTPPPVAPNGNEPSTLPTPVSVPLTEG